MQLELFPGYTITSAEVGVEINNAEAIENQFEVLLYADTNTAERDLVIRVNSPEANVVFTHIDPNEEINVYIDGTTVIKGNLCITGDLLVSGKINHIGSEDCNIIRHLIGDLEIAYDVEKNMIFLNGKEFKNYSEIGKAVSNNLRKNQDKLTFNNCKDFFNY